MTQPEARRSIDVRPGVRSLPVVRRWAADVAWQLSEDRLMDTVLMVSELVANSIHHAGLRADDTITLTAERWPDRLRVSVRDRGRGLPWSGRPAPDALRADGGRGLSLVHALSDEMCIDGPTGQVTFEMRLARSARLPDGVENGP